MKLYVLTLKRLHATVARPSIKSIVKTRQQVTLAISVMVVTDKPPSVVWSLLAWGKARKESFPRNREELVAAIGGGTVVSGST